MKQDSHNTYIRVGTTLYKQVKKPPLLFSLAGKKRNTITNPYREKVGRLCEAKQAMFPSDGNACFGVLTTSFIRISI